MKTFLVRLIDLALVPLGLVFALLYLARDLLTWQPLSEEREKLFNMTLKQLSEQVEKQKASRWN